MSTDPELHPRQSRLILERLAQRARIVVTWERLWPALAPVLCLTGVFLAVSWLGLWIYSPRWFRIAILALFGMAFLATLWPLFRLRQPDRLALLGRIDRDSQTPHRPATTLDDHLAQPAATAETRALWNLHLRRANEAVGKLKVAGPVPGLAALDRYAIRAAVVVAVVAAAFVAGPEKYARVASAFDWRTEGGVTQGFRLDAWIDPPAYTGRPPQLLRASVDAGADIGEREVRAPVGSHVIVRASVGAGVTAETVGGLELVKADDTARAGAAQGGPGRSPASIGDNAQERTPGQPQAQAGDLDRWRLTGDGELTLRRLGRVVARYSIASIPDAAPTISLVGQPRSNVRGSLTLRYKLEDDYGILSAEAHFSDPRSNGRALSGRRLYDPPEMILALPTAPGGIGEAETTRDLSDHPWAGAEVAVKLSARDEGGNTGVSEPVRMFLPQRPFVEPLARALVEQRRRLALSPDDLAPVKAAFEALMMAPAEFNTPLGVYLGLRIISQRLQNASNDDHLRSAADLMWEMALRLEEGDLTGAERDLRAAQQALRDALERGASDEELARLMQELRAALDRFLREFAQQQLRNPDAARDPAEGERMLSAQDLNALLDQLERMARSGNQADAQRMLDQLQRMLENLRSARRSSPGNAAQQMNRALNQLDQMMRDQQQLRDRTHREGQREGGARDSERGELQQRQQALRRQLQDLQRQMQQFGLSPPDGMQDAEREMGAAGDDLGKGQQGMGSAAEAQRRAIDGLRRGAQAMAQQMQQQGGPGGQDGPGDPSGPAGRETANPDPLGREMHNPGDASRAPFEPPGAGAAQRAQRILEELRRRLSDPARPTIEMDYLERLLRRY